MKRKLQSILIAAFAFALASTPAMIAANSFGPGALTIALTAMVLPATLLLYGMGNTALRLWQRLQSDTRQVGIQLAGWPCVALMVLLTVGNLTEGWLSSYFIFVGTPVRALVENTALGDWMIPGRTSWVQFSISAVFFALSLGLPALLIARLGGWVSDRFGLVIDI